MVSYSGSKSSLLNPGKVEVAGTKLGVPVVRVDCRLVCDTVGVGAAGGSWLNEHWSPCVSVGSVAWMLGSDMLRKNEDDDVQEKVDVVTKTQKKPKCARRALHLVRTQVRSTQGYSVLRELKLLETRNIDEVTIIIYPTVYVA